MRVPSTSALALFIGACLNRRVQVPWHAASDGRKIILVSESNASASDHDFLDACIAALTGSDYRVVISLSASRKEELRKLLPNNFEINTSAYNFQIMPHAALTITQAGMGTAVESISCGAPVLAIPRTPYHAEVAYRVAELGLGIHLPEPQLTPEAVSRSVESILNDAYLTQRVHIMQQVFKSDGGAVTGANRIEAFLESKRASAH
jgi:macrolide glycosyltransferase